MMEDGNSGSRPTCASSPTNTSIVDNEHALTSMQMTENPFNNHYSKGTICKERPSTSGKGDLDGIYEEAQEFDIKLRTKTIANDSCYETHLNGSYDFHESPLSDCSVFNKPGNSEEFLSKKLNDIVCLPSECNAMLHSTVSNSKVSKSQPTLNGCTYRSSCGQQLPNVCLCSFSLGKNTENATDSNHSPKCASDCCSTKTASLFQWNRSGDSPKTNGFRNCEPVQELSAACCSERSNFWCESYSPSKAQALCHDAACSSTCEYASDCKDITEGLKPQQNLDSIVYIGYESEKQMPDIMGLIQKDLSEPYSVYTYRYFIHNWPHLCFLAFHDEKCVGAVVCKLDMHKKSIRRGYIAMLAVDENYRKKRIGSNLVLKAIHAMIMDDADEVVLETEITNKPALQLYENLGFVRDKRLFRYYLNGVDALRLKLWLK